VDGKNNVKKNESLHGIAEEKVSEEKKESTVIERRKIIRPLSADSEDMINERFSPDNIEEKRLSGHGPSVLTSTVTPDDLGRKSRLGLALDAREQDELTRSEEVKQNTRRDAERQLTTPIPLEQRAMANPSHLFSSADESDYYSDDDAFRFGRQKNYIPEKHRNEVLEKKGEAGNSNSSSRTGPAGNVPLPMVRRTQPSPRRPMALLSDTEAGYAGGYEPQSSDLDAFGDDTDYEDSRALRAAVVSGEYSGSGSFPSRLPKKRSSGNSYISSHSRTSNTSGSFSDNSKHSSSNSNHSSKDSSNNREEKSQSGRGSVSKSSSHVPVPTQFYSYEILKNRANQNENPFPQDVDVHYREQYLSDVDFEQLFKMDKATFNRMTKWRKQELKKKYQLF